MIVSVDAEMVRCVDSGVQSGRFGNRSYGFEYCAKMARDGKITQTVPGLVLYLISRN